MCCQLQLNLFSRVLQRDILPITQYLLQDTQPEVRSSVCRQLPSLLCKVDQLSENLLLTSLLDAAQDNSAQVRCAVLDVLIDSEPYIFKGKQLIHILNKGKQPSHIFIKIPNWGGFFIFIKENERSNGVFIS